LFPLACFPYGTTTPNIVLFPDKVKGTDTPDGKAKARDDARKRLMAAKRAMRQRRDSESGDMIFVK